MKKIEIDLKYSKQLITIANYPEAYDKIWDALIASDSLKNPVIKYKAYQNLSLLYSIFYKNKKAISAIDSMFLYAYKSNVLKNINIKSDLYYTAALTYRMNENYSEAKRNLDISEHLLDSINSTFNRKIYVLTEKAHMYTLTNKYEESEKILTKILKEISEGHNYASIIYSMLGDLYVKKNESLKALTFYNKSLKIISKQHKRIGLQVSLLEKAAKINHQLENYKLAYQQVNESKVLGDSLFGSQSIQNKQLFEIKDSYRNTLVKNNKIKKEQELKLIKAEKEKLNLQLIFSVVLVVITILVSFFGIRLTRKKMVVEKKLLTERANAELEIKKKELAVTALQLIEKDKLLEEIKKGLEEIKRDKDDTFVEQIKSTINVNSAKTWEEFETRFIQVNNSFYESLGQKHTNLSRNELKLCALVKLNFSTKEMSQLLGVSADSVNKARYRLRKKLELKRDDNLVTYINSI
ncbi:DNA-binding CsgD family transcriptional regulator [Wenyingzhuangia heitensis]|uniref:DNA-binding CsgD family transcriptional regulator n=1 Tax=Wenyingzhuangia heitensis TaxID=1487859 RepID=A0ABX0U4Z8_9FLAO|nr:hypothetical protein [Wenyingzhuangia heitensis]NIJ43919.1 DNA-binding CsgD family transcriptional regulator [Wenyingzhuangia heitensis]